ncbi:MAG: hypothetical protein RLN78_05545 [Phycisphaerales bacterium]
MWVTQTYLGNPDSDAKIFVYYMFENYVDDQNVFTNRVQRGLEDLGQEFGNQASLLMPNPRFAASISSEMLSSMSVLWQSMQGKLPGLLLTTKPLSDFDPQDGEYHYFTLKDEDIAQAVAVISQVRRIAYEHISWNFTNADEAPNLGLIKRFVDSIELKLQFGMGAIDLKKLFRGNRM